MQLPAPADHRVLVTSFLPIYRVEQAFNQHPLLPRLLSLTRELLLLLQHILAQRRLRVLLQCF